MALAEECFNQAKDIGSLLLLYTSSANADGLRSLAEKAKAAGQHNVAFTCLWQVGDVDACLDILLATDRTAEAVLFAQTYKPSRCKEIVGVWKQGLDKAGKGKVSRLLGIPGEDEEMFPEWANALQLEQDGSHASNLIDVDTINDDSAPAELAETEDDAVAESSGAADGEEATAEDETEA